jgi:alkylated DNA repair dioxygenase AlkB
MEQHDLFGAVEPTLPKGFRYGPDIVSDKIQQALLQEIPGLPFEAFDFHGFKGKRRTVSYGWKYDFSTESVQKGDDIPALLLCVRDLAGKFAGIDPELLVQALVSEYGPGAPIGWHKDKFVFGRVVGVSLASSCTFRLRRHIDGKWKRHSIILDPGSAYLMSGDSRTLWEHSIPPVHQLRYSITFRELNAVGGHGRTG